MNDFLEVAERTLDSVKANALEALRTRKICHMDIKITFEVERPVEVETYIEELGV